MRWFGRLKRRQQDAAAKKSKNESGSADTFIAATGAGWVDSPQYVAGDGGSQSKFVHGLLAQARDQAQSVEVGEEFTFRVTEIPQGITSPHEIVFGIMMIAEQYDIRCELIVDEGVRFTRMQ